jgi:hypothetical protein
MYNGQDYDSFDINNFYTFCSYDPFEPTGDKFRYDFCDIPRSEALEQMIIGSWIKNHKTIQEMTL